MKANKKLDIREILKDLDKYEPRRRGWTWRKKVKDLKLGRYVYSDCSESLKQSVPLPAAKYFDNIDRGPMPSSRPKSPPGALKTTSGGCGWRPGTGRPHHGHPHGRPVPFRRPDRRHAPGRGRRPHHQEAGARQRKALDIIEDEVGRPINYHSYVSGSRDRTSR